MFFLQYQKNCQPSQKIYIPAYISPEKKPVVRRISLPFLQKSRGSMTVEAAFVLPIFLFFVLNLLSVIEMLRFHGNLTWALHEVGGRLAVYGNLYEDVVLRQDRDFINEMGDTAFSYLYVKEELEEKLGRQYAERSPVVGGMDGLFFSKADIMKDDKIQLVLAYQMRMPFPAGGTEKVGMYNCYYARAWTGYDVAERLGDMVYVTAYGEVYHVRRSCPHLALQIRSINVSAIGSIRNSHGEKYSKCSKCGNGDGRVVYVTEDGNRYHGDRECSGLKRTITEIPIQEAVHKGYPPCATCGGGQ